MKQNYNKWTEREDECLKEIIESHGAIRWTYIAKKLEKQFQRAKRTGKQCRQRWFNHLKTDIDNSEWTLEEDLELLKTYGLLGNKWTQLAKHFPGRTDNQVKNRFFSTIKKSLRSMCKGVGLKTTKIEIYQIKPNVISQVFYLSRGDRNCGLKPKDEPQFQHTKWSLNLEECLEISQLIKQHMVQLSNKKKTCLSAKKERYQWAIKKIIQFNHSYLDHNLLAKQARDEKRFQESSTYTIEQPIFLDSEPTAQLLDQILFVRDQELIDILQILEKRELFYQNQGYLNRDEISSSGDDYRFYIAQNLQGRTCYSSMINQQSGSQNGYDFFSDQDQSLSLPLVCPRNPSQQNDTYPVHEECQMQTY